MRLSSQMALGLTRRGGGSSFSLTPDIYVDSVAGNDSTGDGTEGLPYATLSKATSEIVDPYTTVGIKRGSRFYDEFRFPAGINNVKLTTYGTGDIPVIDQRQDVSAGSWTVDGTYSNQWNLTVTAAKSIRWVMLWDENDDLRTFHADKATLDSAGSDGDWTCADRTPDATSYTITVKSTTRPDLAGLTVLTNNYNAGIIGHEGADSGSGTSGQYIEGPIEVIGGDGLYGPVHWGNGKATDLIIRYGTRHHFVAYGDAERIYCDGFDTDYFESAIVATAYRDDATNVAPTWSDLIINMPTPGARVPDGFYAHGSGAGPSAKSITFNGLVVKNCARAISPAVMQELYVNGAYFENNQVDSYISYSIVTMNCVMSNSVSPTGSVYPLETTGATTGQSVQLSNFAYYTDSTSNARAVRWNKSGDFSMTNSTFTVSSVATLGSRANWVNVASATGYTSSITGNVFILEGADTSTDRVFNIDEAASSTFNYDLNLYAGDKNINFDDTGAFRFSFANWVASGTKDQNSVFFHDPDTLTNISANLFQGTGPADGNFALKTLSGVTDDDGVALSTFGDGSSLQLAGVQSHWDWSSGTVASGAPTAWPNYPSTAAEARTWLNDPASWSW